MKPDKKYEEMKSICDTQEKMEEKVISEIKTEFQGAQGKNRLKCNFTRETINSMKIKWSRKDQRESGWSETKTKEKKHIKLESVKKKNKIMEEN